VLPIAGGQSSRQLNITRTELQRVLQFGTDRDLAFPFRRQGARLELADKCQGEYSMTFWILVVGLDKPLSLALCGGEPLELDE
jgi:hypothetical protein